MTEDIFEGYTPLLSVEPGSMGRETWKARLSEIPEISSCAKESWYGEVIVRLYNNFKDYKKMHSEVYKKMPVPLSKKKFSGQLNIRIDHNLHKALAMEAHQKKISLNALISTKLDKVTNSKEDIYEWHLDEVKIVRVRLAILCFSEYGGREVWLCIQLDNLNDELEGDDCHKENELLDKIQNNKILMDTLKNFLSSLVLTEKTTKQNCVLLNTKSLNKAMDHLSAKSIDRSKSIYFAENEKYLIFKLEE